MDTSWPKMVLFFFYFFFLSVVHAYTPIRQRRSRALNAPRACSKVLHITYKSHHNGLQHSDNMFVLPCPLDVYINLRDRRSNTLNMRVNQYLRGVGGLSRDLSLDRGENRNGICVWGGCLITNKHIGKRKCEVRIGVP